MNLEKLTKKVSAIASEAETFIRGEAKKFSAEDIQEKSLNNFVTYVDKKTEEQLVDKLSALLPGCGFIAEESPALSQAEFTWVIDPLDGTTNFIHGVPVYSVSIGLLQGQELLSGVILEINHSECFYTWKSAPAFLNGTRIRVSQANSVQDSLLATGFPYFDYGKLDDYLDLFRYLMQNSRGVRRLGSAAADMAYVACGRFDGFYEYGLSPWDVSAGALLVENAGGRVSDFGGGKDYLFGREMIATNGMISDEFLKLFKNWKRSTH